MKSQSDPSPAGRSPFPADRHHYRGRIAPTPTGYLHLGHARTFWIAAERARLSQGTLIYRNEDLDRDRCQNRFVLAAMEDLHWLGIFWQEGPGDLGGPFAPYDQSLRLPFYREIWSKLQQAGAVYPSPHSRKDVERAITAPHEEEAEVIFPLELRPPEGTGREATDPAEVNWRFRVPVGRVVEFSDLRTGNVRYVAGTDFGDFLVWRKDGLPAYELAVVADDVAMQITEVVRGADLLLSTARQLLLYEALGWAPPVFYHCPLVRDATGQRLAKRNAALSLRTLRDRGVLPNEIRAGFADEIAWQKLVSAIGSDLQ